MGKRTIFLFFLVLFLSWFFNVYAAYESATMGLYEFESTMRSMQLYNEDTGSWVDVLAEGGGGSGGEYIVDIASGNFSNQIGAYSTNKTVTAGTYSKIRVTIKNYCQIQGWVLDESSGIYYVTDADSYITDPDSGIQYFIGTSEFTGAGAPSAGDCEEITLVPPPGQEVDEYQTSTINFTSNVTINQGDTVDLDIVFDLSQQLGLRTQEGPGGQTLHMILPPEPGSETGAPVIYLSGQRIN